MNSTSSTRNATHRGPFATPAVTSSAPTASPRRLGVGIAHTSAAPIVGMISSAGKIQLMYRMELRNSRMDQRSVTAPTTARTPRTRTQAYVPT
jgi:hypothetical protein